MYKKKCEMKSRVCGEQNALFKKQLRLENQKLKELANYPIRPSDTLELKLQVLEAKGVDLDFLQSLDISIDLLFDLKYPYYIFLVSPQLHEYRGKLLIPLENGTSIERNVIIRRSDEYLFTDIEVAVISAIPKALSNLVGLTKTYYPAEELRNMPYWQLQSYVYYWDMVPDKK